MPILSKAIGQLIRPYGSTVVTPTPVDVLMVDRRGETRFIWTFSDTHPDPASLDPSPDLVGLQIQDASGTWRSPVTLNGGSGNTLDLEYAGTFDTTTAWRVQAASAVLSQVFSHGGSLYVSSGTVRQVTVLSVKSIIGTVDWLVKFSSNIDSIDDLGSFEIDNIFGLEAADSVVSINGDTVRLAFPTTGEAALDWFYTAGGASFLDLLHATSQTGASTGLFSVSALARGGFGIAYWQTPYGSDEGPGGGAGAISSANVSGLQIYVAGSWHSPTSARVLSGSGFIEATYAVDFTAGTPWRVVEPAGELSFGGGAYFLSIPQSGTV